MREILPNASNLDGFESELGTERFGEFTTAMTRAADLLDGRTLWHINSAAEGGGVAEILQSVLGYLVAIGIDVRWSVIEGGDDFFALTKRLHNMLHGSDGDSVDNDDRALYERTLDANLKGSSFDAGAVVVLHDPQTVGLAPAFRRNGCTVLWSCHIGADEPNASVEAAWDFLLPYARATQAQVFSRRAYAWEGLADDEVEIIPPCIDACAVKNEHLDEGSVRAILSASGVIPSGNDGEPTFTRPDGSEGMVKRPADLIESAPMDPAASFVVQVSRWDVLKDPVGVMKGFVEHVAPGLGTHLMLAGPAEGSIDDDPESKRVIDLVRTEWKELSDDARARVHIACLPMDDIEENAAIVNALQRRADVVVQKSKAEGFGLTVAEAMWKAKAVVGSRVGGIQDQIEDGESGLLVDPDDLSGFGASLTRPLEDRGFAKRIGSNARERVSKEYLADRYLIRWMQLVARRIA